VGKVYINSFSLEMMGKKKFDLVMRNVVEVVSEDNLKELLKKKN